MQNTVHDTNTDTINRYLEAMQIEVNSSPNYKDLNFVILTNLSRYLSKIPFEKMKRDDVISYLNSVRKTDEQDPMHRWIGTYNLYLTCITRFFRWLSYPDSSPKNRPKPKVVENIPQLKRKEISIYKPTDLWSAKDDLLFLKWCPNERDRCYHSMARDTSGRPHEILNLKIKDIVFKTAGNKQYAECLVNGKTGSRHLPLIDSIPYVKDWLDVHPQRNNANSYLFCTNDRRFAHGSHVTQKGLHRIYQKYKKVYFPKLLDDPKVPTSEKEHIRALLLKPWNPYVRRHSALTDKSKFLKESTLRQHAGWSGSSKMQLKYVHYYGNESNNSILQEYGIIPKDSEEVNVLKAKQCTNCNETNRPDQKFCVNCKMALTFEAYAEKDDHLVALEKQIERLQKDMSIVLHANMRKSKALQNVQLGDKLRAARKKLVRS